jgi:hypothetical protein
MEWWGWVLVAVAVLGVLRYALRRVRRPNDDLIARDTQTNTMRAQQSYDAMQQGPNRPQGGATR